MIIQHLQQNTIFPVLFFLAALLSGCTGYHLILDEVTVLEQDSNHVAYRVTVKNDDRSSFLCRSIRFYGATGLTVTLADSTNLNEATVIKGAGGAGSFGHAIPDDPNNAYNFRVLDVNETYTFTFSNVTPTGGIDPNVTPYLIFQLKSSTDKNYAQNFKTGTGLCIRYGMTRSVDLRN